MPGKKRNNGKYTMGRKAQNGLHDVALPSGDLCQARRPGVQGLIAMGLLDNFDELTALVQTEHIAPKTPQGIAAASKVSAEQAESAAQILMRDKDKLATAFHMMDKIVAGIVVQPPVWIDYQGAEESDEDFAKRAAKAEEDEAVAVRDIDMEDKLFLINWAVGGASDLAAFREGSEALVGGVATVEALRLPTE